MEKLKTESNINEGAGEIESKEELIKEFRNFIDEGIREGEFHPKFVLDAYEILFDSGEASNTTVEPILEIIKKIKEMKEKGMFK